LDLRQVKVEKEYQKKQRMAIKTVLILLSVEIFFAALVVSQ
jgi:hypothetical protein